MKNKCPKCNGYNTEHRTSGIVCSDCNYPINVQFFNDNDGVYFIKNGFKLYIEKYE